MARQKIDRQLAECGWLVRDYQGTRMAAVPSMAVRRFPMKHGQADYLLFGDETTVGVVTVVPTVQTMASPQPSP